MTNQNSQEKNDSAANALFSLPAVMTIDTAEQLATELKQLSLTDKAILVLDASKTEAITTPGLQLIIALEKSIATRGGELFVHGQKEVVTNAFWAAGLQSLLKAL